MKPLSEHITESFDVNEDVSRASFINSSNLIKSVKTITGHDLEVRFSDYQDIMTKIFEKIQTNVIPFFQNDALRLIDTNEDCWSVEKIQSNKQYYITHLSTTGRYNNRGSVYTGKNNIEFPFFLKTSGEQISIIVSKSDKMITICVEDSNPSNKIKKLFTQDNASKDWFLAQGWVQINEAIKIINSL